MFWIDICVNCSLSQLSRDEHIAACLSDTGDDVIWWGDFMECIWVVLWLVNKQSFVVFNCDVLRETSAVCLVGRLSAMLHIIFVSNLGPCEKSFTIFSLVEWFQRPMVVEGIEDWCWLIVMSFRSLTIQLEIIIGRMYSIINLQYDYQMTLVTSCYSFYKYCKSSYLEQLCSTFEK